MKLEIYLFVDPLSRRCYQHERAINELSKELNENISVHFVPLVNIKVLNQEHEITSGESLQELIFNTVLDYKAASFQGQKRGRNFLLTLQEKLFEESRSYCSELVEEVAEACHLDSEMFLDDRRSELARQTFRSDQQTANEMNVSEPSAVVFNNELGSEGVLIKDFDHDSLFKYCQSSIQESRRHFASLSAHSGCQIFNYPESNQLSQK
ncbi:DsbA family protein [Lentilactobacillus sp. Marseille-Q4993]|uniref:DsbA family protein n=1 Tax=Lentilactobacillus sp. Marseille-Q4993 TaxID=3039492 RepID=UPI0024BCD170|nr:DsbA family protein [Lentilactobacillus sp. Marseille-Q4993]